MSECKERTNSLHKIQSQCIIQNPTHKNNPERSSFQNEEKKRRDQIPSNRTHRRPHLSPLMQCFGCTHGDEVHGDQG